MEFRQLGHSGLQVPVLSFGSGTFGGGNEFFKAWGATDVAEATRLVDVCLDAGVNLFDTADVYSKDFPKKSSAKPSPANATASSSLLALVRSYLRATAQPKTKRPPRPSRDGRKRKFEYRKSLER
jgi:aryl-alcohol dehydrogenase-like predicted oxidoreductase